MRFKPFSSMWNKVTKNMKIVLHGLTALYVLLTYQETNAMGHSSWVKKVNLNGSNVQTLLFSSTVMHNVDCAKLCGNTEFCTYYGFDETLGTCKCFKKRGNAISPALDLQIWQKSCRAGYKYMVEPRWCIKVYDKIMTRDQAESFCTSKKSRLTVIDSEAKKTFADEYFKALYPNIPAFHIGLEYVHSKAAWRWSTGEYLDKSSPWAKVIKDDQAITACAIMWNGSFNDQGCGSNTNNIQVYILCEEV